MKIRKIRITLLVVLALFASACEKEEILEPEALEPEVVGDYMPLGKGSTWKYAVEMQKYGEIEKYEAEVYATWTESVRGVEYRKIDGMAIVAAGIKYGAEEGMLLRTEGGIVTGTDEDREYTFLKSPLEVGTKWEVTSDDYKIIWGEILAKESVFVPAGEFRNCLKVRYTVQNVDDKSLRDEYAVLWLAPNVGLVKSESKEYKNIVLSELASYSIKNLPAIVLTIVSTSPTDGGTIEVPGKLTIQFDYPPKSVLVNGNKAYLRGTVATLDLRRYRSGEFEFRIEWEDDEGKKQEVIKLDVIEPRKPPGKVRWTSPPNGGIMQTNGRLKITFDNPVKDVTVNGIRATGSGKSWTWNATRLTRGRAILEINWTNHDGSKDSYSITVTVKDTRPPDTTPPKIKSSTPKDGAKDVAPEKLNRDGMEIVFDEPLKKVGIAVTIEGEALKWTTELSDDKTKAILLMLKGGDIAFEAEVVLEINAVDFAGNKAELKVTFTTQIKE